MFVLSVVFFYFLIDAGVVCKENKFVSCLRELLLPTDNTPRFISLLTLLVSLPVMFAIWFFRDINKTEEIENSRKDTNLRKFQKLQEWATGNIPKNESEGSALNLQISALHQLRAYLKGSYGKNFRRAAFEIYAAVLQEQYTRVLKQTEKFFEKEKSETEQITELKTKTHFNSDNSKKFREQLNKVIQEDPLTRQINRIASEDYFHLLLNHGFPLQTISLIGVDLSGKKFLCKKFGENLNLQQANFQYANLEKTKLQEADLSRANLQGVFTEPKLSQNQNSFEEKITCRIGQQGKLKNISRNILSSEEKKNLAVLFSQLKNKTNNDFRKSHLQESAERIKNSDKPVALSEEELNNLGSYSEEEAKGWIEEYTREDDEK